MWRREEAAGATEEGERGRLVEEGGGGRAVEGLAGHWGARRSGHRLGEEEHARWRVAWSRGRAWRRVAWSRGRARRRAASTVTAYRGRRGGCGDEKKEAGVTGVRGGLSI